VQKKLETLFPDTSLISEATLISCYKKESKLLYGMVFIDIREVVPVLHKVPRHADVSCA